MHNNAILADIIFPRHFAYGLHRRAQMPGATFGLRIVGQVIRRAHLGRNSGHHLIITPFKDGNQLFNQRDPMLKRSRRIGVKSSARCCHGQIDIVTPANSDDGADFLSRRIYGIHSCGRCRGEYPFTVNIGF